MRSLLVICVVAGTARAEPERLALGAALHAAIERNPSLAAKGIDVAAANDQIVAARGAQDWVLATDTRWDASRSRDDARSDTVTAVGSLTRPLPGGGSLGLRADATIDRRLLAAAAAGGSPRVDTTTGDVLLVLRQPLLRGWGGDAAPATALARTTATRDIARLEATATAAALIRDVVRAYWEVAYARDELAIRRASLALAEEQLRITRARVASGRLAGSETLAVGEAIAQRRDDVAQSEVNLVAQSLALAQLLGREVHDARTFDPSDAPPAAIDRDVDREVAYALERSPELATVHARGRAARIEVDVSANGRLPALDLVASGGVQGTSLGRVDGTLWSAELQLSIPLGNRAATGAHAAAVHQVQRARFDERDLALQITSAVVGALTTMQHARTRVAALDEAIRLADQGIDAERARWEDGKSTNYDVMRRQAERADSELRRARAQADYLEAEAVLDELTGAILPRYGIATP